MTPFSSNLITSTIIKLPFNRWHRIFLKLFLYIIIIYYYCFINLVYKSKISLLQNGHPSKDVYIKMTSSPKVWKLLKITLVHCVHVCVCVCSCDKWKEYILREIVRGKISQNRVTSDKVMTKTM